MDELKYTNEFLKNLEAVLKKEPEIIKMIKKTLEVISQENSQASQESLLLQNIKTYSNQGIFIVQVGEKQRGYNVFWTEENAQKIILSLTKNQ